MHNIENIVSQRPTVYTRILRHLPLGAPFPSSGTNTSTASELAVPAQFAFALARVNSVTNAESPLFAAGGRETVVALPSQVCYARVCVCMCVNSIPTSQISIAPAKECSCSMFKPVALVPCGSLLC